jgi:hypothetical protein
VVPASAHQAFTCTERQYNKSHHIHFLLVDPVYLLDLQGHCQ